jgi:sterol desaturase/sphingolipid hydroxylase (fatty acid hydroxylase superfamily)
MLKVFIGVGIAWVYSHILEYYAHKFLHRFNKKHQPLAFHMREHHVKAKRNYMSDSPSKREAISLMILLALHAPICLLSPSAFITLVCCSANYLYVHNRSHYDVNWGCDNVPWHVDHHTGNQQANWGVRSDWIDRLLRTKDSKK